MSAELLDHHVLMGGKLHVYRRPNSGRWQCSSYLAGRNQRVSTGTDSLAAAKAFAEDWYLTLHGKIRSGEIKNEKTFRDAATAYEREYEVITEGQRNLHYVQRNKDRLRVYLLPYFGKLGLSEVTSGKIMEYRVWRQSASRSGKAPARSTLHQEIVTLRQVLKTALRKGWISHLPDLSAPYQANRKVSHRAWFSPDEYRRFYTATRERAKNAAGKRWQWECEQLHDFVLFMANTGLRPDEAVRLEYRDVEIVMDEATEERILEIAVRGKRGVGICKSTRGAVRPFERLTARNKPLPTDLVFPKTHRDLFNTVLGELDLKLDREGNRRTAYSLRHTYISMRLLEGADIYMVAKNCRTSVEMIQNYYAAHIRTSIDAAAVNVRRSDKPRIGQSA